MIITFRGMYDHPVISQIFMISNPFSLASDFFLLVSLFCFFPCLFSCRLIPNNLDAVRSYPFVTTFLPASRCISSVYVQFCKIAICLILSFSYSSRICFWLHFCLIFLWLCYGARLSVLNRDMLQGNMCL